MPPQEGWIARSPSVGVSGAPSHRNLLLAGAGGGGVLIPGLKIHVYPILGSPFTSNKEQWALMHSPTILPPAISHLEKVILF